MGEQGSLLIFLRQGLPPARMVAGASCNLLEAKKQGR